MKRMRTSILLFAALTVAPLQIDAAQQHFQGKTVTLQVGSGAGGRQDRIARTLAKYMMKYIPGSPVFVIQNKPGGRMFTGKEVLDDVKVYTDWRPEIMSMYKRLAHEAPK